MSPRPNPEQLRDGFPLIEEAYGADEYHRRLESHGYVIVHPDDVKKIRKQTKHPYSQGWNACRDFVFGVSDD